MFKLFNESKKANWSCHLISKILFLGVIAISIIICNPLSAYAAKGVMKQVPAKNDYGRDYYSYFLIEDEDDLRAIGSKKYPLDANYLLKNDITLDPEVPWEPIGDSNVKISSSSFRGVFDGMGHTISGLWIVDETSSSYVGFFRSLNGGVVRNLIFDDVDVTISLNTKKYVGCIAGIMSGKSRIENCGVLSGKIKGYYAAGIAGYLVEAITLEKSFNMADIHGEYMAAGIAAYTYNARGIVRNCFNTGSISVEDNGYAAGILGESAIEAPNVTYCYNTGYIDGENVENYGAMWAKSSKSLSSDVYFYYDIYSSYPKANVEDKSWVAWIAREAKEYSAFGVSRDLMKKQSTYIGWDFDKVWGIDEGKSLPYLKAVPKSKI